MKETDLMETKVCTRCGIEKPLDEFYMVKYKGKEPKYRYSVCTTCTRIEQRRRRLLKVDPDSPQLEKINKLYDMHREAGRSVPDTRRSSQTSVDEDIDTLLKECGGKS
jgi:hypothetical protein